MDEKTMQMLNGMHTHAHQEYAKHLHFDASVRRNGCNGSTWAS